MDSERKSLPQDNCETKATFRKPSGDVANRNYRRHSPVTPVSSSSDGKFVSYFTIIIIIIGFSSDTLVIYVMPYLNFCLAILFHNDDVYIAVS
uniref:Arginine/serine-rich coiled-coil protein 2 isoform X3 n=1 Tax=Rhizophora mucronata TaxID=61149 RepID=A0A2P2KM64_RHIMU